MTTAAPIALRPGTIPSARVVAGWDDLAEMGASPGEIIAHFGMTSYAVQKAARRQNRPDIYEAIRAWRAADRDRLLRATGRKWW